VSYNESQQPRFSQAIARLHDVKGNPAPQITPEINHSIQLDQTSFSYELEALLGRRNCFVAVSAPAIAAVSAGLIIKPAQNTLIVITGLAIEKAVAGSIQVQLASASLGFSGTFATSFAFFRDSRWGDPQIARPSSSIGTHLTGGLPLATQFRRVFIPANSFTVIPIVPGIVIAQEAANQPNIFGVFNETLNEAMEVYVDFYERQVGVSELKLPQ